VEHSLCPRLSEYVFEEGSLPLTIPGDVGSQTGNPTLIKRLQESSREVTHGKYFGEEDIHK